MRIAVLVKQIPAPVELTFTGGHVVRTGVPLETSAYCRRANARAVTLADGPDDEVVVFTMGPPSAVDVLREMIACGAHRGILVSDRALAGSDTLVTAAVLAKAIRLEGPFDLVLTGACSLDSETGHVGIQVAEMLGLPFVGPCRRFDVVGGVATGAVEYDGGYVDVEVALPLVASAAERLCTPSKTDADRWAQVPAALIREIGVRELGFDPAQVGSAGSPTRVRDTVQVPGMPRRRLLTTSVTEAARLWHDLAVPVALPGSEWSGDARSVLDDTPVWCVLDPTAIGPDEAMLAAVSTLARSVDRRLLALTGVPATVPLGVDGQLMLVGGSTAAEDWSAALADRLRSQPPHAVVVEATTWGREFAARVAARLGWGLVGDATSLTVDGGRLLAWKSAFSGQALVPVTSTSPTLMVSVRPGALGGQGSYRSWTVPAAEVMSVPRTTRVTASPVCGLDHEMRELHRAKRLVVVGAGVEPEGYPLIDRLRVLLGAGPIAATRKVADQGWLPRSRQIGITGRSVAPELVLSIGASGRFSHTVGFSRASVVMAVNADPDAEIFAQSDIGIVGDWRAVVTELIAVLTAASMPAGAARSGGA
ncbi:FAD-binding protein [Actinoplanes sp. TFC3]|uniref:FAD-binding protein n=1 Tax=Actinoplanes sp. TFC3 TaxID=1710355 RepID=UPI000834D3C3|nr:FAD-binding protein [Actinoplanes sp. TFC3]